MWKGKLALSRVSAKQRTLARVEPRQQAGRQAPLRGRGSAPPMPVFSKMSLHNNPGAAGRPFPLPTACHHQQQQQHLQ